VRFTHPTEINPNAPPQTAWLPLAPRALAGGVGGGGGEGARPRVRLLEEKNAKTRRCKDAKVVDLARRSKRCQAIRLARRWVTRQSAFHSPYQKIRMQGRAPDLLGPKRSTLGGLVKFLAVGCGLNEFSPNANIGVSILANSMAVYLTPQACSLTPALPTPSLDEQNSGGGSPGSRTDSPGRSCSDKPSADPARSRTNSRRESRLTYPASDR